MENRPSQIPSTPSARLRLMVITDRGVCANLPDAVAAALRGGARAVQLREKDMGALELLELARRLRRLTREHSASLIVNDRIDVALAADADGAHLGWRSLPVGVARRLLGPDRLIGVSTHSPSEAARAQEQGADYVTFGPVFDTPSKRGLVATQGVEGLAECVRAVDLPVVAVGGVLPEHVASLRDAGAIGVAVIRGVLASPRPEEAARAYLAAWDDAP